jgi:hypothetical protein
MVPTHWGDFTFWSSLFRQAGEGVKEFLRVPPTTRDVELRLILIRQMGVLLIIACNAITIQVRRGYKIAI